MMQVLVRTITRRDALKLAYEMLLVDTPEHLIREALLQYGFYTLEAHDIIREARTMHTVSDQYISPKSMALGFAIITGIMLLMVIALVISTRL